MTTRVEYIKMGSMIAITAIVLTVISMAGDSTDSKVATGIVLHDTDPDAHGGLKASVDSLILVLNVQQMKDSMQYVQDTMRTNAQNRSLIEIMQVQTQAIVDLKQDIRDARP